MQQQALRNRRPYYTAKRRPFGQTRRPRRFPVHDCGATGLAPSTAMRVQLLQELTRSQECCVPHHDMATPRLRHEARVEVGGPVFEIETEIIDVRTPKDTAAAKD